VAVEFPMNVELIYAHPKIAQNRGRVAIRRGPLIYCFEEADNGADLENLIISEESAFAVNPGLEDGLVTLTGSGWRDDSDREQLYSDTPGERAPVKITAVPYFSWDNRAPGEMRVWLRSGR
jgi:uncharacterized protein